MAYTDGGNPSWVTEEHEEKFQVLERELERVFIHVQPVFFGEEIGTAWAVVYYLNKSISFRFPEASKTLALLPDGAGASPEGAAQVYRRLADVGVASEIS